MTKRRTNDLRALRARREAALKRPELTVPSHRPGADERRLIEEAVAAGRVTICAPAKRRPDR